MIEGVIFDYGGVFTVKGSFGRWFRRIVRENNLDETAFRNYFFQKFNKAKVQEHSDFFQSLGRYLNCDAESVICGSYDAFRFDNQTLEIAQRVKNSGSKLGLLTNNIPEWYDRIVQEHDLGSLFDVLLSSHECGLAKPDSRIYLHFLDLFGIDASKCVFIDDKERNLIPARELGINCIRFTDASSLESELESYQVF